MVDDGQTMVVVSQWDIKINMNWTSSSSQTYSLTMVDHGQTMMVDDGQTMVSHLGYKNQHDQLTINLTMVINPLTTDN